MGAKCLEIKYIQGKPYVYHSTNVYDRETKKTRKVSQYLGRLIPDRGLLAKGSSRPSQEERPVTTLQRPRSVHEYGNARLLAREFQDLVPVLTEAFPDHWQEIVALVFTRITGYLPLKRVKASWEKLDNPLNIRSDCSPRTPSTLLRAIGDDRIGQDRIFQHLCTGNRHLISDLSFITSRSPSGATMPGRSPFPR